MKVMFNTGSYESDKPKIRILDFFCGYCKIIVHVKIKEGKESKTFQKYLTKSLMDVE